MILGLILVMFFYPVNKWLSSKIQNKIVTSLLMTALTIILIIVPVGLLITSIGDDAREVYFLVANLDVDVASESIYNVTGLNVDIAELTDPLIMDLSVYLRDNIPNVLSFATDLFIKLFLLLFVIYYGFKEGDKIVKSLLDLLPFTDEQKDELVKKTKQVVGGVLYGQFLVALIQGILGGIAFWILGLSNPVFWGVVMGVLSFIPLLGTPIVWGPTAAYLIYIENYFAGIGLLLFGILVIMNVDNFLKPYLIGGRSGLHPLIVLIGILGGISLMGVIGFIVGPIILALSLIVIRFFNEEVTN